MQFTTITTTSALLTLLTLTSAAPAPQAAGIQGFAPTSAAAAPPATETKVDKSTIIIDAGRIGVGLAKLNDADGLTFLMDQNLIQAGSPDTFNIHTGVVYEKLEVAVGTGIQPQTLRCKILDPAGRPIFANRGTNLDDTFSDANNGFWTLNPPSQVSSIICDPKFVAFNRNPPAA